LIRPVGDRFGLVTVFYHADISVPMGFLIIFDGGFRYFSFPSAYVSMGPLIDVGLAAAAPSERLGAVGVDSCAV